MCSSPHFSVLHPLPVMKFTGSINKVVWVPCDRKTGTDIHRIYKDINLWSSQGWYSNLMIFPCKSKSKNLTRLKSARLKVTTTLQCILLTINPSFSSDKKFDGEVWRTTEGHYCKYIRFWMVGMGKEWLTTLSDRILILVLEVEWPFLGPNIKDNNCGWQVRVFTTLKTGINIFVG